MINKKLGQVRGRCDATFRTDKRQSVVLFDVASPLSWFSIDHASEHEVKRHLGELSALTEATRTNI